MRDLYAVFKAIIIAIWLIDIMNIGLMIGDFNLAEFLDTTFPINGWFWFCFLILLPSTDENNNINFSKDNFLNYFKEDKK